MSQNPSGNELVLLKALWRAQPLSAREIHDICEEDLSWSFSSTRTTLKRMLEKSLISHDKVHGVTVYRAQKSKVSTLGDLMRDFMHRVIEMDGPLPVAAFQGSQILTEDEIKELEDFLDSETQA